MAGGSTSGKQSGGKSTGEEKQKAVSRSVKAGLAVSPRFLFFFERAFPLFRL